MKRWVVAIVVSCAIAPLAMLIIVSTAIAGSQAHGDRALMPIEGVDPAVMAIVVAATRRALEQHAGCDVDPILVLAHMSIEWPPGLLGQGRGESAMAANGDFLPIIQAYAPVPGADTDGGSYDGSATSEYAVGPLQQVNAFRATYGLDGNDDGRINQNNLADATATEAVHACATRDISSKSLQTPEGRRFEAGHYMLPAYPTSAAASDYGDMVEAAYQRLRSSALHRGQSDAGAHAFPVDPALIEDEGAINAPHHDYPAWDFAVATGTTVYAAAGGVVAAAGWSDDCGNGVTINADDGGQYTYCHGTQVLVTSGGEVSAGDPILLTGSTGASTGPHLHLQIRFEGHFVCPQPLLAAWYRGDDVDLTGSSATGCFY